MNIGNPDEQREVIVEPVREPVSIPEPTREPVSVP